LNFLDRCSKYTRTPNFMKFHLVGAEFFHADRRTDMMKLIVTFSTLGKCLEMHVGVTNGEKITAK
jgi:hypothetical protein